MTLMEKVWNCVICKVLNGDNKGIWTGLIGHMIRTS